MPTVEILSGDERLCFELPLGGRLLDGCDEHEAPVPFSCRSASCGICRMDVLDGAELLLPAGHDERETLDAYGDGPTRRLACSIVVRASSSGLVRLRVIND